MPEPKERPILFNGDMVRAILEGRKVQTRRPISDDWWRCLDPEDPEDRAQALTQCPFGAPGDRLWVRETWQAWRRTSIEYDEWEAITPDVRNGADWSTWIQGHGRADAIEYRATSKSLGPWTPSIHMPRWASRLTLEVTEVRVQRLQEMSVGDVRAEGLNVADGPTAPVVALGDFARLWESIYGDFDCLSWVWAVSFRVLK